MKMGWTAVLATALLFTSAASAQNMQVQPQAAQVATGTATTRSSGVSCLSLSSHTYVVEMQGGATHLIAWMRFMPDGTGNGTAVGPTGAGATSFTIQCTSSPGWSSASPMPIRVTGSPSGNPIANGNYNILIGDGGARFAIINASQNGVALSGWGVRQ